MPNSHVRCLYRVLPSLLPVLGAACANAAPPTAPPPPVTYVVSYGLSGTAGVVFDSVKYETAWGGVVTIVAPSSEWSVSFSAPEGAYAYAAVWARALMGGQSMTLTAIWSAAGQRTTDRSQIVEVGMPGPFGLDIGRTPL